MGLITNAQNILSRSDFTFEEVEVPEWGGSLRLKSLSGAERTQIIRKMQTARDTVDGIFEKLIILSAVDESGRKLFEDDPATLAMLQQKDAAVTQRIGEAVMRISGINRGARESAEKN